METPEIDTSPDPKIPPLDEVLTYPARPGVTYALVHPSNVNGVEEDGFHMSPGGQHVTIDDEEFFLMIKGSRIPSATGRAIYLVDKEAGGKTPKEAKKDGPASS